MWLLIAHGIFQEIIPENVVSFTTEMFGISNHNF